MHLNAQQQAIAATDCDVRFDRLTRRRGWSTARYQEWLASTMRTLLFPDPPSTDPPSTDPAPGGSP